MAAGDAALETGGSDQDLAKWRMAMLAVSSTSLQASCAGSQKGWRVASRGDCAPAEEEEYYDFEDVEEVPREPRGERNHSRSDRRGL